MSNTPEKLTITGRAGDGSRHTIPFPYGEVEAVTVSEVAQEWSDRVNEQVGTSDTLDSPTDADTIRAACYMVEGYGGISSADLAAAIKEKRVLDATTFAEIMEAVAANSGSPETTQDELGALLANQAFMQRAEQNLESRSADGFRALGKLVNGVHKAITGVGVSSATKDAIGPGIDGVSVSYLTVAGRRTGHTVDPANVDAVAIDDALGRA